MHVKCCSKLQQSTGYPLNSNGQTIETFCTILCLLLLCRKKWVK